MTFVCVGVHLDPRETNEFKSGQSPTLDCGTFAQGTIAMARNKGRSWTEAEDQKLMQLLTQGKSERLVASALARTLSAVSSRLYVLRTQAKPPSSDENSPAAACADRKSWTTNDELRLQQLVAEGVPRPIIATALRRTVAAVENRLNIIRSRTTVVAPGKTKA